MVSVILKLEVTGSCGDLMLSSAKTFRGGVGWILFNLIFITCTFQNQKTVSPDATPHQSKQTGVLRGFGHTTRATQPNYCIMSRVMAVVEIWSYRPLDYVCYDPRLHCPRQSDMMLIHLRQVWWCRKEFCSWLCFGLVQFPWLCWLWIELHIATHEMFCCCVSYPWDVLLVC